MEIHAPTIYPHVKAPTLASCVARPINLLFLALGPRAFAPRQLSTQGASSDCACPSTVTVYLTPLTPPRRHASLLLLRQPELLPKPRLARLRVRVRVRVRGKVRARVRVRVRVR